MACALAIRSACTVIEVAIRFAWCLWRILIDPQILGLFAGLLARFTAHNLVIPRGPQNLQAFGNIFGKDLESRSGPCIRSSRRLPNDSKESHARVIIPGILWVSRIRI
jgi:hypothetical protein